MLSELQKSEGSTVWNSLLPLQLMIFMTFFEFIKASSLL